MLQEETGYTVATVTDLRCRYAPAPWEFAVRESAAIDRHWAAALEARPQLFNGRVLMLTDGKVVPGPDSATFEASHADIDFKAFLAWRDWGHPARGWRNCFGMAALQAADGAFILGEMSQHTANAGRVYFPSGTPDLDDVEGTRVDLAGSIRRELREETGLALDRLRFAPALTVIEDDRRVCVLQRVRAEGTAEALVATIAAHLATEARPELVRMHVVRDLADITPAMPPFVRLYLRRSLTGDEPARPHGGDAQPG